VKDLIFWKDNFTGTSGIDYVLTRYGHVYDDPTVLMFHAAAADSVNMLTGYLANGMCNVNSVLDVRQYRYFLGYQSIDLALSTVLSVASSPAVIQLLLDAKADVNPRGCASVLTGSLINNRPDSVKMLLEAGASMQAYLNSLPLLMHSVSVEHYDKKREQDMIAIFNLLMDAGVKTRPYNGGRTILHETLLVNRIYACCNLPVLVKNVFLPRDPGLLEARDGKGNTALLSAFVDNVNSDIVFDKAEAMLDAGADPIVCDALGETVLMKAMWNDDDFNSNRFISEVIKSMLKRTLSVSHATPHVDTPGEAGSGESSLREPEGKRRRT
jgi:CO/xanthine dehydrogenase FAD-binding subunit